MLNLLITMIVITRAYEEKTHSKTILRLIYGHTYTVAYLLFIVKIVLLMSIQYMCMGDNARMWCNSSDSSN